MPSRARRPCTASGCPDFAGKSGRCDRHEIPRPRPKPQPRPSSTALGYDYQWRKKSEAYRRAHPVCEVPGCGRPSEHTDHVDGDNTNWEPHNLQALCRSHHSQKTALHDGGFGNARTPR
jgi:5-methylcytosine-specific restriction enzyme A